MAYMSNCIKCSKCGNKILKVQEYSSMDKTYPTHRECAQKRGDCGLCGQTVTKGQPRMLVQCKDCLHRCGKPNCLKQKCENEVYCHFSERGIMDSECLRNNPWNWKCIFCEKNIDPTKDKGNIQLHTKSRIGDVACMSCWVKATS